MRKISGLLIALLILNVLLINPLSYSQISSSYHRGSDYSITCEGNKCRFESQPRWIFDGSSYQPYIFNDSYSSNGYYEVSNAFIGARIYDHHTVFYTPDFKTVKVYDERFEVDKWRPQGQGSWDTVGAQSGDPTITVKEDPDSINITRSFTSWAGVLSVEYIVSEGQALKHEIFWNNTLESAEIYRVRQLWAGIVGDRVNHKDGLDVISSKTTLDTPYFLFLYSNGSLSVFEDQSSMYYSPLGFNGEKLIGQNLEYTDIDVHAQGMKADFIFANWTLAQNEALIIDPVTVTIQPDDGDDTRIRSAFPATNYGSATDISVGDLDPTGNDAGRALLKFNLSSIPSDAIIDNATVDLYETNTQVDAGPNSSEVQFNRLLRDWVEGQATWNIYSTGNNWQTAGAAGALDIDSTVSANLTMDDVPAGAFVSFTNATLEDDVQAFVNGTYSNYGWRISALGRENQGANYNFNGFVSSDFGGAATDPRIIIDYTLPPAYLTTLFFTGISSINVNGTSTANLTETAFNNSEIAIGVANAASGYVYHYWDNENVSHIHDITVTKTMTANSTITAFAIATGGGGFAGTGYILTGVLVAFVAVIVLASRKK